MGTQEWQGRLCPLCSGGVLEAESTCRWCAAPLTHPAALRAFEADDALAQLRDEYTSLRARWDSVVGEKATAAAALREALIEAAPEPVLGAAAPPPAPIAATAIPIVSKAPEEQSTASESPLPTTFEPDGDLTPSVATPVATSSPQDPDTGDGGAQPRRDEPPVAHRPPRRTVFTTPVLLGISGAALLIVSAVIFVAVTWASFPVVPQVLVILGVAAVIVTTAMWLQRQDLPITAGAVGAVAVGFASLSVIAVERSLGVFGALTAAATLLAACLFAHMLARVRLPSADGVSASAMAGALVATTVAAPTVLGGPVLDSMAVVALPGGAALAALSTRWLSEHGRSMAHWSGLVWTWMFAVAAAIGAVLASSAAPGGASSLQVIGVSALGVCALLTLIRVHAGLIVPTVTVIAGATGAAIAAWCGGPWQTWVIAAVAVWAAVTAMFPRMSATVRGHFARVLMVALVACSLPVGWVLANAFIELAAHVAGVATRDPGVANAVMEVAIAGWAVVAASTGMARRHRLITDWLGTAAIAGALWSTAVWLAVEYGTARWVDALIVVAMAVLHAVSALLWRTAAARLTTLLLAGVAGLAASLVAFSAAVVSGEPVLWAAVACLAPVVGFAVALRWFSPVVIPAMLLSLVAAATVVPAAAGDGERTLVAALIVAAGAAALTAWRWARVSLWVEWVTVPVASLGGVVTAVFALARTSEAWFSASPPGIADTQVLPLVMLAATACVAVVWPPLRPHRHRVALVVGIVALAMVPGDLTWIALCTAALLVTALRDVRTPGSWSWLRRTDAQVLAIVAIPLAGSGVVAIIVASVVVTVVGLAQVLRERDADPTVSGLMFTWGAPLAVGVGVAHLNVPTAAVGLAVAVSGWAVIALSRWVLRLALEVPVAAGIVVTVIAPVLTVSLLWSGLVLLVSAGGWLMLGWRLSVVLRAVAAATAWLGSAIVVVHVLDTVQHPVAWFAVMTVPLAALSGASGLVTQAAVVRRVGAAGGVAFGLLGVWVAFAAVNVEQPPVWLSVLALSLPVAMFAVITARWPAWGMSSLTVAAIAASTAHLAATDRWHEALVVALAVCAAGTWIVRAVDRPRHIYVNAVSVVLVGLAAMVVATQLADVGAHVWFADGAARSEPLVMVAAVLVAVIILGVPWGRPVAMTTLTALVGLAPALVLDGWAWLVPAVAALIAAAAWWRVPQARSWGLRSVHVVALAFAGLLWSGPEWWPLAVTAAVLAVVAGLLVARGAPLLRQPMIAVMSWMSALSVGAALALAGAPVPAIAIAGAIVGWLAASLPAVRDRGEVFGSTVAGAGLTLMTPALAGSPAWAGSVLLISAVGWMALGWARSAGLRVLAVAVAWCATGLLLVSADVTAPEPYVVVPAAFALVIGWRQLTAQPGRSSIAALGPGLAIALAPSLVALAMAPQHLARTLGLVAMVAVLAGSGVLLRLRAPVLASATTAVTLALTQVTASDAVVPRWVAFAVVGALLLTLGATYERWRALR